jgi:TonB family protein
MNTFRTVALATIAGAAGGLAGGAARAADEMAQVVQEAPAAAVAQAIAAQPKLRDASGRAVARCKVSAAGVVSDCVIAAEAPSGSGVGALLLATASQYHVKPASHDGQPVDSAVLLELDSFPHDHPADWQRRPTAEDLLAVFPTAAYRNGVSGHATISCLVSVQGAVFDCYVDSESPVGAGFGQAALALTPQFLFRPATLAGKPVLSAIRIPIAFKTFGGGEPNENMRKTATAAMIWPAAPTYADVVAAYPAKARAAKLGGRATLFCQFTRDGRLT